MYSNDYMYAIERSPDYLAHYGIRGMKWGVRKAIASGNSAKLSKHYAKAQKKLAKLEKRAANSSKYARRAALMGTGAAIAGGAAALGTKGIGRIVGGAGNLLQEGGYGASRLAGKYIKNKKISSAIKTAGQAAGKAGYAMKGAQVGINKWGNSNSIGNAVGDALIRQGAKGTAAAVRNTSNVLGKGVERIANKRIPTTFTTMGNYAGQSSYKMGQAATKAGIYAKGVSNNTIARIGAGAIGAGLAAGAARNAYKAATAQKKAARFKSEMNKAFAGTKYANGGARQGKKRRR